MAACKMSLGPAAVNDSIHSTAKFEMIPAETLEAERWHPGQDVLPACRFHRLSLAEQDAFVAGCYRPSGLDVEVLNSPLGALVEVVVGSMDYALCNDHDMNDEELPSRILSRLGEGNSTLHAEFIMARELVTPLSELVSLMESSPEALNHVLAVALPYATDRFIQAKHIAASIAAKQAAQAVLNELLGDDRG